MYPSYPLTTPRYGPNVPLDMATEYKNCPNCSFKNGPLPTSAFGKNSGTPDGLSTYCKECNNRIQREWKKSNPDKVAKWKKDYLRRIKKQNRERQQNQEQEA